MNIGAMRHVVDVMEPATTTGSRGERQGADRTIMREVFCSITPLAGREAEVARQLVATATVRVEMRGPIPLTATSFLKEMPSGRKLHIGHVSDPQRNGFELSLLCTEEV